VAAGGAKASSSGDDAPNLLLAAPAVGRWHRLTVRVAGSELEARLDDAAPKTAEVSRGDGGRILLRVPAGRVSFDDVEFLVPRRTPDGGFYPCDRPETDWWREGGRWVDHNGVTCALMSNWISLVAPKGQGRLWHKRSFGPDVRVGFAISENTEWFGWDREPSHVHHPFDNVQVLLAPAEGDPAHGYRLELNSRGRRTTVLYRGGKPVAEVPQTGGFPMRYRGGHAPYFPRRCRIALVKRGGLIRAIVNGLEVLRYTDREPLIVARVGLGGYRTRINFSNIDVHRLAPRRAQKR
jgi:hypothetical protein